jgi:hypothetical protein
MGVLGRVDRLDLADEGIEVDLVPALPGIAHRGVSARILTRTRQRPRGLPAFPDFGLKESFTNCVSPALGCSCTT